LKSKKEYFVLFSYSSFSYFSCLSSSSISLMVALHSSPIFNAAFASFSSFASLEKCGALIIAFLCMDSPAFYHVLSSACEPSSGKENNVLSILS
jgi:hypothetical protein